MKELSDLTKETLKSLEGEFVWIYRREPEVTKELLLFEELAVGNYTATYVTFNITTNMRQFYSMATWAAVELKQSRIVIFSKEDMTERVFLL